MASHWDADGDGKADDGWEEQLDDKVPPALHVMPLRCGAAAMVVDCPSVHPTQRPHPTH